MKSDPQSRHGDWGARRERFETIVGVVIVLAAIIAGLGSFVRGIVDDTQMKSRGSFDISGTTLGLIFFVSLVLLAVTWGSIRSAMRPGQWSKFGRPYVVATFAWLVVAFIMVTACAGLAAVALVQSGHGISSSPPDRELEVRDSFAKFAREGIALIPLFDIPSTVGWRDPIPVPRPLFVGILLVYKLVILLMIIAALRALVRLWRTSVRKDLEQPFESVP